MDKVVDQICKLININDLILRDVNEKPHKLCNLINPLNNEWLIKLTNKEFDEFKDIVVQHVIDDFDYYFHDSHESWINGDFNIDNQCYNIMIDINEVIEEFYIIYKIEYESEQLIKRVRNGT